jgi:hypothetical protein
MIFTGKKRVKYRNFNPKILVTEQERIEQLNVATLLLETDTWVEIAGGMSLVDDGHFANIDSEVDLAFTKPNLELRKENPLSKDSIWHNDIYSSMVDNIGEFTFMIPSLLADADSFARRKIKLLKLARKVLKFSRTIQFDVGTEGIDIQQFQLHNELIKEMASSQDLLSPFDNLLPFFTQNTKAYPQIVVRLFPPAIENIKLTILMFSLLHFTTAHNKSSMKFCLKPNGYHSYTSSDIIFASMTFLDHFISVLHLPTQTTDLIYKSAKEHNHASVDAGLPCPTFFSGTSALTLFLVASAGVKTFRAEPFSDHAKVVFSIARGTVMNVMTRISTLFPALKVSFVARLQNTLDSLPIQ